MTGESTNAIKQFEISETYRNEIPRMLYGSNNLGDLQSYIDTTSDPVYGPLFIFNSFSNCCVGGLGMKNPKELLNEP